MNNIRTATLTLIRIIHPLVISSDIRSAHPTYSEIIYTIGRVAGEQSHFFSITRVNFLAFASSDKVSVSSVGQKMQA
jgi:hypothetical protein